MRFFGLLLKIAYLSQESREEKAERREERAERRKERAERREDAIKKNKLNI